MRGGIKIHVFLHGSHNFKIIVFKDVAFLQIRFSLSVRMDPEDLLARSESEQDYGFSVFSINTDKKSNKRQRKNCISLYISVN